LLGTHGTLNETIAVIFVQLNEVNVVLLATKGGFGMITANVFRN
jgi:hypothetical protein